MALSRITPVFLFVAALAAVFPSLHAAQVAAGPMVGAPEMRSMPLWVQLDGPGKVQFSYWPASNASQVTRLPEQQATRENGYTVTSVAAPLDPGTAYGYAVAVDGKQINFEHETTFTTTPFFTDRAPPPDFTVALGSGHRVNDAAYDPLNRIPGDGYGAFLAILAKQPAFMLWAGNSVTLREPDWGSREAMIARYGKERSQPEMQSLMASVPQAAAFSRGEVGPENAGKHFRNLDDAHEVFDLFWPNPTTVSSVGGAVTTVRYGDAEFFLLDDRSFRDMEQFDGKKQILGTEQIEWLRRALRESSATFKVVVLGTSALSPSDSTKNLKSAPNDQKELMEALTRDRTGSVVFVCGGKDFGELTKMVRANAPDLYELSLGPLTDRPTERTDELNFYRVPNTSTFTRQFATMRFHGSEDQRQLTISVFDSNGTQLWTQTIAEDTMRF
ncbi:MAG: alkaline phosphatase D family protein [Puniceicoccales bacterium]